MIMDGVLLYAISKELSSSLLGARIDKIYDTGKKELLFKLRNQRTNYKLRISTHASRGAVYLSQASPKTPMAPSLFAMVLRKHLSGGIIRQVKTTGMDRILTLTIEAYDELGDLSHKELVIELMGKHSNCILLKEDGTIIDALTKYDHLVSRHREILTNRPYLPPPASKKYNLLDYDLDQLSQDLLDLEDQAENIGQAISLTFEGFSTKTASDFLKASEVEERDLSLYGRLDFQRLIQALGRFRDRLREGPQTVYLIRKKGRPHNVSLFPVGDETRAYDSVSRAIDDSLDETSRRQNLEKEKNKLAKALRQRLKKQEKKETIHADNIKRAKETDIYRIKGELLTANMHNVRPGMTSIKVDNYYDPAYEKIEIDLDPSLSPAANASRYFKRVSKIREAAKKSREIILSVRREIDYLESLLYHLDQAETMADIEDILSELGKLSYHPQQKKAKKKKKKKEAPSQPRHFISSQGNPILVGKNNRQNDRLRRKAQGEDLWFHAKDIPGSHVILKVSSPEPSPQEITEAASLAAYYSKGQSSSKVTVDYLEVKGLKKPKQAKPGMVIYHHNQSVLVDPQEAISLIEAAANEEEKNE